jgi:hypothetical protein
MYNRGDLLPTAQDFQHLRLSGMSEKEISVVAEEEFRTRQELISETCRKELTTISETTRLGITFTKVQIERFQLKNDNILLELEAITLAGLQSNRERAEGELKLTKAGLEKEARERVAAANASVALAEARAAAEVLRTRMEQENYNRKAQAEVDNKIEQDRTSIANQIQYDKQIKEAEAKAMAIKTVTEAEYMQKVKEAEAGE